VADYNVVIVGSGVAGALCAAGLAGGGRKVLVLEAAENGLGAFQREQFRRVWDIAPAKSWNTPFLKAAGIRNYPSPGPSVPDKSVYFEQPTAATSLTTFKGYYQRLAGGSTWAWRGNTPRMMPNDLRLKSEYFPNGSKDGANVADWPLTYDDLKPWYLKAEYELGVSGNAEEWERLSPRDGEKFPMPGQPKSYSDKILIAALGGPKEVVLGGEKLTAEVITMAQARNTRPYDGRPACEGNHNCIPLCPTGAKYDAAVHLKRALLDGVELRSGCVVTRLEANGSAISKVHFKQWNSSDPQAEQSVTADIVILAANPIETPKILLNSRLYPTGDPYVGRHLMDHVQGECLGLTGESNPIYPFRGPQTICGIDSLRGGKYRSEFASFRLTLGNDGWGRAGNPTSVLEEMLNPADPTGFVVGKSLRRNAVLKLTRLVRFGFSTEQLPHGENRVELSSQTDALGIPRPKITYKVHDYTLEALRQGYRVSKELFAAMGATHVGEEEFNVDDWNTAAHPMGTCRMGTSAADSVTDKFGRCHNYPNLFIVGASVFPTGSATNPVMTLSALALMTVSEIKGKQ
jgi:glucose dehydrogenase